AEVVKSRKVPDPHHDILTPEEIMPLFAALAPAERPIFAAAIFTGLRKSELCGSLKADVDLGGASPCAVLTGARELHLSYSRGRTRIRSRTPLPICPTKFRRV